MKTCDILLTGVGGQGVVTLGDLIARAALAADVPVAYVPSKGMAQRGGFVEVEIRLGQEAAGPRISAKGADLVLAMERSESLKGIAFVKPEGRFVLYDHVWEPTGVLLGEHEYPAQSNVLSALQESCREVVCLNPADRPSFDQQPVAANIYALGALAGSEALQTMIDSCMLQEAVVTRWPKAAESNLAAYQAGFVKGNQPIGQFLGDARNTTLERS